MTLLGRAIGARSYRPEDIGSDRVHATLAGEALRRDWLRDKATRYLIATIGPVSSAATQFTLSLVMLRLLSPEAFGAFTFLLVASQLSWGVWSALLCAPLPVLLAGRDAIRRSRAEDTLLGANLVGAALAGVAFVAIASFFHMSVMATLCYAAYGAVSLVRWFGRAYCYVQGAQARTVASDVTYSATTVATLYIAIHILRIEPQLGCYFALLIGAIVGLLPFGWRVFARQIRAVSARSLWRYGAIWQAHARWALVGVVTTEATANAHVYLITLLKGPAAFAPIAASALLMRPVNVAQNALSDFERPQMAMLIASMRYPAIRRSLTAFRLALAAIWLGTVVLMTLVFLVDPHAVFPKAYDTRFLIVAASLWAIVASLRLVQMPESTLLQAAGAFKPLAMASLWSSIGSIATVFALILLVGPLWSIAGIIAGAAIYWGWTYRFAAHWMRAFAQTGCGSRAADI